MALTLLICSLPHKNGLEKNPLRLWPGDRKSNHFENTQSTLFLTRPFLMETLLSEPNSVEFYQSLTDLRKWKYPPPVRHSLAASPKGGWGSRGMRSTCEGHSSGTGSLKDLDLITGIWIAFFPTPGHHISRACIVAEQTWKNCISQILSKNSLRKPKDSRQ